MAIVAGTILAWAGVLSLILTGVLAALGYLDKSQKERRKEKDELDESLIKSLQRTVEEHKKNFETIAAEMTQKDATISTLRAEVNTLTLVLQGRDKNTIDMMSKIPDILKVVQDTNQNVKRLVEVLDKHLSVK